MSVVVIDGGQALWITGGILAFFVVVFLLVFFGVLK